MNARNRQTGTDARVWAFRFLPIALFAAVVSAAPGQLPASPENVDGWPAVAGEVLVKFRGAANADEHRRVGVQVDADRDDEIGGGVHNLHSRSLGVGALLAFLSSHPSVEYAEPNYIVRSTLVPNDPQMPQLWGLLNPTWAGGDIRAEAAWDVSIGSRAHVVGVIDTGSDYTHEDLSGNMWTAPSSFTVSIGGQSITCAAGTHGFNAIANVCDPMDDNHHGTHTAGTVGAVGNNGIGVSGVNQTASIMALKFLDASGSGSMSKAVNAIEFAIQTKKAFGAAANVRVLSNSWGGGGFSQTLLDAINKANSNDMLFVAAAGNSGANTDTTPFYPASFHAPNVIAVAANDSSDLKAPFSNYGATSVHLAAPGVGILSTVRGHTYQYMSGTSMATPHVAGAAALVLSHCALNTAGLKNTLLTTVDQLGSLMGLTTTGGRLNANSAIRGCASAPAQVPSAPTSLTAAAGDTKVTLSWSGSSSATSYTVKRGTTSGNEVALESGATSTSFVDSSVANGTKYFYVVSASNAVGESPNSNEASASPAAPVAPPAPSNLKASAAPRKVNLSWSGASGATSYVVMRSTTSGGPYSAIASGIAGTKYQDQSVTRGTTYYYVVAAVNAAGTSGNSNQAGATAR